MPGAFNTREAIRKTWLNHKYWNWPSLPVIPGQIQDRIIIKVRFVHLELIVLSTYITYISNLAYIYIFSLNLYIQTIFLIGRHKYIDIDLKNENDQNDDILQADFHEHLYNLTLKDHMYLDYIRS